MLIFVSCSSSLLAKTLETYAVLPFSNMSENPEMEGIGYAIAETLNTSLPSIKGYVRVGRLDFDGILRQHRLSEFYDDIELVRALGLQLGARHLIVGSYSITGDYIHVAARFVSVSSGTISVARTVSVKLDDIFEVSNELAKAFSESFGDTWTSEDSDALRSLLPVDLKTYMFLGNGLIKLANGLLIEANTDFVRALLVEPNNRFMLDVQQFVKTDRLSLPFHGFLWHHNSWRNLLPSLSSYFLIIVSACAAIFAAFSARDEPLGVVLFSFLGAVVIGSLFEPVRLLPDGRDDYDVVYDAMMARHKNDSTFGFVVGARWESQGRILFDIHELTAGDKDWKYVKTVTVGLLSVHGKWIVEQVPKTMRRASKIPSFVLPKKYMRGAMQDELKSRAGLLGASLYWYTIGMWAIVLILIIRRIWKRWLPNWRQGKDRVVGPLLCILFLVVSVGVFRGPEHQVRAIRDFWDSIEVVPVGKWSKIARTENGK